MEATDMEDEHDKTPTPNPEDTAGLLARIQDEWSTLIAAIDELTAEQMNVPDAGGWSIKDNLAHLAAWEQYMLHHYLGDQPPYEAMQIDRAAYESLDEDGINAVLYERNKDRSVEEVLTGLKRSHQEVVATLQQMNFADLLQPLDEDDPQKRPVLDWVIGNTYDHYQEHRRTIQAMLEN
jgi:hypothetical protein